MRKFLSFFLLAGLMAWAGVANAQTDYNVRVGSVTDSSYNVPIGTNHNYSYTQMIYNYSYMPGSQPIKINSISFYYTGVGSTSSLRDRKIVVYMKNVSSTFFNSDSAYISVNASNRVYVGNFSIPSSPGWVTIDLQNQFIYKCNSSNHLLIAIYDSTGSYAYRYFRQRENGGLYGSLSYRSDSYNPNPEASLLGYRGTRVRSMFCPDMKINYTLDTVSAGLPYTTDFTNTTDNLKWTLKNYPDGKNAQWYFANDLHCGNFAYPDYYTSNHSVATLAERKLRIGNSDSIKVSFFVDDIGGEDDGSDIFDYMSVYLTPADTVWAPSTGTTHYTSSSDDPDMPYVLNFNQSDLLHSVKLTGISNQTLTSTFENPFPNRKCKLVFVWRNDGSWGDGTAARISNLSVTEVNRQSEYTPRSTAQWYGYLYSIQSIAPGVAHPKMDHFVTFKMNDLANIDTASVSFSDCPLAATYAGGKVWYPSPISNDKIISANLNNTTRFISGQVNYQWPSSLPNYVSQLAYNPADDYMYFTTDDGELYRFAMSDPEHYTKMGQMTFNPSAFAIDAQGVAYATDGEDVSNLYKVNLSNGATTLVGSLGIEVDWYSSMAFDYNTGELFLAVYNYTYSSTFKSYMHAGSGFYNVNTSNGTCKYIGKILDNRWMEMPGLFAVQTASQGLTAASATELSVFPNPAKDELHVNGVENGTMVMVYDMTGKLVAQQTATENTVINVSGLNKGVYVISAGERKIKFVKE